MRIERRGSIDELAGTQGFADLLAASAEGASRGMPEDLPTSQMSDRRGANWLGVRDGIRNWLLTAA